MSHSDIQHDCISVAESTSATLCEQADMAAANPSGNHERAEFALICDGYAYNVIIEPLAYHR